jgi:hypothetical protein
MARVTGLTVIVGQTGVTIKAREPWHPKVSVARIVKEAATGLVGMPEIKPELAFRASPAGKLPTLTAKL